MSTIGDSTDYSSLANTLKLNNATALLGNAADTKVGALSGDIINQWSMLKANSAAYKKLLQAEATGSVKQDTHYKDLLSDKLFNDYYDTENSKVTTATYKPDTSATAAIDSEATAADNIESMRRLALAAISQNSSLTSTHYDLFESLRQTIAGNLSTSGSGSSTDVTVEDATAATVSKNVGDFHLLTDDQNFTVTGSGGDKNYSFSAGDSLTSVVNAINADSAETGVKATLTKDDDGNYSINVMSTDTGKSSFAKVTQNVGELFGEVGTVLSANGTDAVTQKAEVEATGDQSIAAVAAGTYGGTMFGDQSFTIEGALGSASYSFASGTSVQDVVAAINNNAEATGVQAEVIYNSAGAAEGIGISATKAGANNYVKITQDAGDLFAKAGKHVKVSGSGTTDQDGSAINTLSDLGKVSVNGVTYSFADLAPGGSASLANNPDAALAVLDQALTDIYSGRAVIKGFDPEDQPLASQPGNQDTASTNTLEIGNFGSDAISQWISGYVKETTEA